jgi:hypothetical protein
MTTNPAMRTLASMTASIHAKSSGMNINRPR